MRLHQQLLLGFALVALLVGCVGYVAQLMNARVELGVARLSESAVPETEHAAGMALALEMNRDLVRRLVRTPGSARDTADVRRLAESLDDFETHLDEARAASLRGRARTDPDGESVTADARLNQIEEIRRGFGAYRRAVERVVASGEEAVFDDVAATLDRTGLASALAAYRDGAALSVAAEAEGVRSQLVQADRMLFVAVLLAIGLTLILGILIAGSIERPLRALASAAGEVGRGHLDVRLRIRSSQEVEGLAASFNTMTEQLSRTTLSRRYLATIIHSMTDPLLVTNAEGAIEMANEPAAAMTGVPVDALEGADLPRFFADGEADRILADVAREGFAVNRETSVRRPGERWAGGESGGEPLGAAQTVLLSATVMHAGEAQGVVWVARDVTQQKRVEAELRRARDEAETAARLKSNFLANMSHEVRTPLNGIVGSAQVLRESASGDALEMAGMIERSAVRLLGTINMVLDMARLEAGGLRPHAEPVRLAAEAADALGILRALAEGKGIALRLDERVPDVRADLDPGCFHRIVHNLVGNAIKFTDAGGVAVEIDADEESAVVRVRDTGIGIDTRFLPRLFEEFQQESTGVGRSYEGTGLGLAITKRLVRLMGGTIRVETAKGEGSVFIVRFPRLVPERSNGALLRRAEAE